MMPTRARFTQLFHKAPQGHGLDARGRKLRLAKKARNKFLNFRPAGRTVACDYASRKFLACPLSTAHCPGCLDILLNNPLSVLVQRHGPRAIDLHDASTSTGENCKSRASHFPKFEFVGAALMAVLYFLSRAFYYGRQLSTTLRS